MPDFIKRFLKSGLLAAVAIAAVCITGCEKDSASISVLQLVSSSGTNYVFTNQKIAGGTPVTTGIYARAASETQTLAKFKVSVNYDSTKNNKTVPIVYLDSTLKPGTQVFSMPVRYTPRNLNNRETWIFSITDQEGKEYKQEIQLTTTSTSNTAKSVIYTFSNVLLSRVKFNGKDSLGHVSFSATDGITFPHYVAKQPEVAKKTDFVFNSSTTGKPNLSANTLLANSLYVTAHTPAIFNSINSVDSLVSKFPATTGQMSIGNLKLDQVIAFKSVTGKKGYLHITKVYRSLDSLAFSVKVEK